MAVDVSQVVALVENDGYEAMFEQYDAMPAMYQNMGRIINSNKRKTMTVIRQQRIAPYYPVLADLSIFIELMNC